MSEHDEYTADVADGGTGPDIATVTDTAEPWSYDSDGDGIVDVVQWEFGDGTWQELRDVDGDGNADVLLIDTDGDDTANYQIWDNGDGTYTVAQDADSDGTFESEQTFTRDELDASLPGVSDMLDTTFDSAGDSTPGPDEPEQVDDGAQSFDTDGDGVVDTVEWNFGDGTWQQLIDVDGDGGADVLLIDTNGDDNADYQIWDNGDGTYTVLQDADGDGTFESETNFTRDEIDASLPGITDLLDSRVDGGTPDGSPTDPGTGDPGTETPTTDDGAVLIDSDGDGVADTVHWDFGDGTWQELVDLDGDNEADALLIDTNGDDVADYAIVENGDGTYTVLQDSDGDGVWDDEGQSFTREELDASLPGIGDLLDSRIDGGGGDAPSNDEPDTPSTDQPDMGGSTDDGAVLIDYDGDGTPDTLHWEFGDGTWQELRDVDGDNQADVLVIDTDGDDVANYAIVDNGDGTYTVLADSDSDGQWDDEGQTFTRDEMDASLPGVTDLLDAQITTGAGQGDPGEPAEPDQPTDPTTPAPTGGSDVQVADTDEDGQADVIQWSYPDGTWQQLIDVDGNGTADVLVIDVNGDDQADIQLWGNGDGTYTAAQDTDGDGEFETQQTFTRDELDAAIPGVTDLLDSPMDDIAAGVSADGPSTPEQPTTPADEPVTPTSDPGSVNGQGGASNSVTDGGWEAQDTDGDGRVDVEAWSFADGTWQVLVDVDGNASADVLAIDTDGDDTENIQVWNNDDGTYTVLYDADGDGTFEVQNTFDRAELDARLPGAADLLETTYDDAATAAAPAQGQPIEA